MNTKSSDDNSSPSGEGQDGAIASLIINGDISKLSPQQKVSYYTEFCDKLGLDPLLQPFKILCLHGKQILYCDRGGAQQLNKLYKVSHEIKAREVVSGCYVVTAQAITPDGRTTESIGAVSISNLRGDNLCNAMMKAETKAKRRSTLDLLGLGMLDESEIFPIPLKGGLSSADIPFPEGPVLPGEEGKNNGIPSSLFLSVHGLQKEVDKCATEHELVILYNDNKTRIDKHPQLKQLFTNRKNELRRKMVA